MPKDISKNVARYKIAGGELNEFEFQQNQQDLAEQQKGNDEHLIPGTPPEQTVAEVVESAQKIVAKRSKSASAKRPGKKTAAKLKVASKKKAAGKKTLTAKKTTSKKKAAGSKTRGASKKKASPTKKASGKKSRKTASKK